MTVKQEFMTLFNKFNFEENNSDNLRSINDLDRTKLSMHKNIGLDILKIVLIAQVYYRPSSLKITFTGDASVKLSLLWPQSLYEFGFEVEISLDKAPMLAKVTYPDSTANLAWKTSPLPTSDIIDFLNIGITDFRKTLSLLLDRVISQRFPDQKDSLELRIAKSLAWATISNLDASWFLAPASSDPGARYIGGLCRHSVCHALHSYQTSMQQGSILIDYYNQFFSKFIDGRSIKNYLCSATSSESPLPGETPLYSIISFISALVCNCDIPSNLVLDRRSLSIAGNSIFISNHKPIPISGSSVRVNIISTICSDMRVALKDVMTSEIDSWCDFIKYLLISAVEVGDHATTPLQHIITFSEIWISLEDKAPRSTQIFIED